MPVELRAGGRELGSALSWEAPQALAAVRLALAFAGLTVDPRDQGHAARCSPSPPPTCRTSLGVPRRRHAARHRRPARQGPGRPCSCYRQCRLVESPAFGSVRRDAAADPRSRTGRRRRELPQSAAASEATWPPSRRAGCSTASAISSTPADAEPVAAADIDAAEPSPEHPAGLYGRGRRRAGHQSCCRRKTSFAADRRPARRRRTHRLSHGPRRAARRLPSVPGASSSSLLDSSPPCAVGRLAAAACAARGRRCSSPHALLCRSGMPDCAQRQPGSVGADAVRPRRNTLRRGSPMS